MAATWCHERHDYVESRKGLLTAQVSPFCNETVLSSSAHLGLSAVAGTETDHSFPPSHTPGSRTYPIAIRECRFPSAWSQPYSQVEQKEAVGGQGLPSLCVCTDRVTTRLEKSFSSGEFLNPFQKTNKQQQNNPTGFSF